MPKKAKKSKKTGKASKSGAGKKKKEYAYAVCGVFCEMCDTGTGKIADTAAELLRLTRGDFEWAKDRVDFDFQDYYKALEWFSENARCPTCRKIKGYWCAVMKCGKARKLKSCLLCDTYLTCKNTEYQRKRYPFVKKSYQRVKKAGLEQHFKEERQRARKGARLRDIRAY